jgi:galactokinase/mevalonate kinase-like predicted kinase
LARDGGSPSSDGFRAKGERKRLREQRNEFLSHHARRTYVIEASSPGRAGIVGNPTDMYGGCVISTTVTERAYAQIRSSDRLIIESGDVRGEIRGEDDLKLAGDYLDIIKSVLTYYWSELPHHEFAISCRTDVPAKAGLAGSTALTVAVTGAVLRLLERDLPPHFIAEESRSIERNILGVQCGFQDQCMTAFGGLNYIDLRGKEGLLGEKADEPLATVEPLHPFSPGLPLLLASTGIERHSGAVHTPIRQRWEEGDSAVIEGYRRVTELGWRGKKALLQGDWAALGGYMNENHDIQRDLGGSHPACDRLIEAARDTRAYGAKLAGAGAGGTIIALCADKEKTEAALREAGAFRILHPSPVSGLIVTGEL